MTTQSLIVAAVVACCFVYAAWTLLPQAVRRMLANGLLRLPLAPWLAANLRQAAQNSASCSCAGCDSSPAKVAGQAQPLLFHPRKQEPASRP